MSDTRHELESLLASPGWQLFLEHLGKTWGPGGKRVLESLAAVANTPGAKDEEVGQRSRYLFMAQHEILRALKWPEEEVARLKGLDEPTSASVRPALPASLTSYGRRG